MCALAIDDISWTLHPHDLGRRYLSSNRRSLWSPHPVPESSLHPPRGYERFLMTGAAMYLHWLRTAARGHPRDDYLRSLHRDVVSDRGLIRQSDSAVRALFHRGGRGPTAASDWSAWVRPSSRDYLRGLP